MNSRYMAVASRIAIKNATQSEYQPYLSIYAQSGAGSRSYKLVYRSPGPRDTLRIVPHMRIPPGSNIAFPQTSLSLVGAAEFMQPAVQQLVVSVHTESADCGATNVYVLGMNAGGLVERAAFRNSCSLAAHIESGMPDAPASLALQGPYYAADAALCCPTKSHVRATAKWTVGAWRVTPSYFASIATNQ